MPGRSLARLASRLQGKVTPDGPTTVADRDLLARFLREHDEAAFEALVRRHDRLVRSAVAKVLADPHDAEDAFQATFLVLVRRARAIDWHAGLGPWLYGVAHRVAVKARDASRTRVRKEKGAGAKAGGPDPHDLSWREACALLHAELDRLPDRYRLPLLLCYLEGKTRDEAAAELAVSPGAVKGRLERGREMLRDRLARRGVTLSAGLLAAVASGRAGAGSPSAVAAVLESARGHAPSRVLELVREGAAAAILSQLTKTLALVVGLAAATAMLAAGGAKSPEPAQPPATAAQPKQPAAKRVEVRGRVLGPDDKPVAGAKLFLHNWDGLAPAPQPAADKDGGFAFKIDEEKIGHNLVATAPDHGIAWALLSPFRPFPDLTLRLTADEPIAGKVVDRDGKPIAGVGVSVVVVHQPMGDKTLDRWLKAAREPQAGSVFLNPLIDWYTAFPKLIPTATSDRDGKFVIRGIGRDRVATLRVTGPTVATHQTNVVTREVMSFTSSQRLYSEVDTVHGLSPTLVVTPVPVTAGRVSDSATGKPVPGTALWVEGLAQGNAILMGVKAVADKDGLFVLPGLPQGIRGLSVVVVPPAGQPYHRLWLQVPDDRERRAAFDVPLGRGIPATVKIIDKETRKPVKANLRYGIFGNDNPNSKAEPHVWHAYYWDDGPSWAEMRDEFRIVVFPGPGLVGAAARMNEEYLTGVGAELFERHKQNDQLVGMVCTSQLHLNGWHTLAAIDVPADAKHFEYTIELDRGLTAAGRLIDPDGKPVAGAESYGLKRRLHGNGSWEPVAGADFTALALRPGEKRRVMFVHSERKLAGSAVVVGGAKEPVVVRLERWGEATGRIVDADGKPVVGRVDLLWEVVRNPDLKLGSSPLCRPGAAGPDTDRDGRFRVTGLVPGLTYRWIARGWNVGETIIPDTVAKSGETIDLGDVVVRPDKR